MKRFLFVIIVTGFSLAASASAQFSPTTPLELPSTFDIPLNASSAGQTKTGALTVNGGYTVGSTAGTNLNVTGQICWNGTCQNSWSAVSGGNFVHLFTIPTTADSGYAEMTGDIAQGPAAVIGKAGAATLSRTTLGVSGAASASGTSTSVGVFGDMTNSNGAAVYGWNGVLPPSIGNAWAATFQGKVRVSAPYDLIVGRVGTNAQQARTDLTSYLCLGDATGRPFSDVCKSSWNTGNTSGWALNGTTLWPASTSTAVAAGWTSSNLAAAKFVIEPHPDFTTDVRVSSSVTNRGMVIGSPNNLPISVTCGDHICNGSENGTFGSPNFCAIDCDHISPDPVADIIGAYNVSGRTMTYYWDTPSVDTKGTLVLQKINSPSTSITDGTVVANILESSCGTSCIYTTPSLTVGISYYYTFFTYDYVPNYSTGVSQYARVSGGSNPPPPPPRGGGV